MDLSAKFNFREKKSILALGSEYDTRLAFYYNGEVIFSENIGELAEDEEKYEKFVLEFLKSCSPLSLKLQRAKPDIIITDSHPLYTSRKIGEKLAKKWGAKYLTVQHHIAHIFSAMGDWMLKCDKGDILNKGLTPPCPPSRGELFDFYGIACDGTGYGLDGNIWGGEVFKCHTERNVAESRDHFVCRQYLIERIGYLENQYLIGGELAVEEPARMLISILSKFLHPKDVFKYVKKYYSGNEFNLLWNQLEQKFNCMLSSSTGRVLDAVSILLEFSENKRKYKHYPVRMLEKYANIRIMQIYEWQRIKPKIEKNELGEYILNTTELFKYLIENIGFDNTPLTPLKRGNLGYMAQRYIIEGLCEIVKMDCAEKSPLNPLIVKEGKLNCAGSSEIVFFSGGLAANKVMQKFATTSNIYVNKKIPPGDEGIAMGQIVCKLLNIQLIY